MTIVEIISRHVKLSPVGVNYKGQCPFHQEETPSFIVNTIYEMFLCFGCGAYGNVEEFKRRIEAAR